MSTNPVTPAKPGPYSGTSIPATTPAARPPGLADAYTDEQLQAAIDASKSATAKLCEARPNEELASIRITGARAFLAALQKAEPKLTEVDTLRNTWGRVSIAVDEIDHKGNNSGIDDVLARLAVFKAPEGRQTLPFFAAPHETEAIHELCKLQDMSQQAVLRQALRCYQQEVLRRHGITADLPKPARRPLPAESSAEPERASTTTIPAGWYVIHVQTDDGPSWTPRPGDVVRLKSGGPRMTVRYLTPEAAAVCDWFDLSAALMQAFPFVSLEPAQNPDQKTV